MPFEILVNFPRGAVYFAGERLRCFITVRNISSPSTTNGGAVALAHAADADGAATRNSSDSSSSIPREEKNILALLGVHVYTQCIFVEQRSQPPKRAPYNAKPNDGVINKNLPSTFSDLNSSITSQHAFQCAESISSNSSNIVIVNETERKILACNTLIEPHGVRTYVYEVVIPPTTPASFRGHFIKYYCRAAIGVQTVGIPIQVFRTNLWIMPCPAAIRRSLRLQSSSTTIPLDSNHTADDNANGAIKKNYNKDDIIQLVDAMSARRRRPLEFSIRTSRGLRVGSLLLPKTSYKIGEEIAGTFDFTDAQVSCAQVVVVLRAVERIPPECALNETAVVQNSSDFVSDKSFCIASVQSQFCLPIPLQVSPTFSTDVVQLNYVLHFTFMLSDEKIYYNVPSVQDRAASILWTPPERVDITPLEWQLPVEIWPCDPEHVASVHSPEMYLGSVVLRLL